MSLTHDQQIGPLEVIMYLMAIIAVIGAVAWKWDLFLLLGLMLVALPFLTYWEIRNLEQGNGPSYRLPFPPAKESVVRHGQTAGRPVATEMEHGRTNRVDRPVPPTATVVEKKGSSDEFVAYHHA